MNGELAIGFAPMVPWAALAVAAVMAALVVAYGFARRARGIVWRTLAVATILLSLANPTLVEEQRDYLPNVAVVVMDDSPSQKIGERAARSEEALAHLRESVASLDNVELRVVRAGAAATGGRSQSGDGTQLFAALDQALSDVSRRRLAGVVMITDGQVHDVPEAPAQPGLGEAPFHVLLSGERNERDRRLILRQAPGYGIVGKTLTMTIRVEELGTTGRNRDGVAEVTVRRDGEPWKTALVPVGEDYVIEFELEHAGASYFEIATAPGPGELSLANNRAVAAVNGVRDRLRVLLISGEPHPGERTWRNLLKADPAVDLVHFTILRPPEKQDRTPVSELSLISFPVHELFDLKLYEFDLIIFDRYRRRGVLLNHYLDNIAQYVDRGGALLVSVGPTFAEEFSLFNTPLGRVLPGRPTGRLFTQGFRPEISAKGARHPVTAGLPGAPSGTEQAPSGTEQAPSGTEQDRKQPRWGRWFRQIEVAAERGAAVMSGVAGAPVLILDRVGEGRVVQVLSDHIWLWSRGYEGGGPQAELLRRTAHWLMKEPELEEDDLRAEMRGGELNIARRSLEPDDSPVEVTSPSGARQTVALTPGPGGRATGTVQAQEPGIYRISDGKRTALAAVGALNPREFADLRTTDQHLGPLAEARGGGVLWLADSTRPEIRRVKAGRDMTGGARLGGQGWIGLRSERDYVVTGVREISLLPGLLVLLLGLGGMAFAWRREGA